MYNRINNKARLVRLAVIMIVIVICSVSTVIAFLYSSSLESRKLELLEMVTQQSELIGSIARFDALYSQDDHPDGATAATMEQVINALENNEGFGETGEITLGVMEDNNIKFIVASRQNNPIQSLIPIDSRTAGPMRLALSGNTGTVTALDYDDVVVLAAYVPLPELNAGLVVKIDRAEINAPFITAGLWALLITLPIVIIGVFLFQKIGMPLVTHLEATIKGLENTEEALNQAVKEAQTASKSKSDFLANMSHELRTPLNAIIGFSTMMKKQVFGPMGDKKYVEYADDISKSGEHLHNIICEILDLSKVEAGSQDLNIENVEIIPLLDFCINTVKTHAATKGIKIIGEYKNNPQIISTEQLIVKRIIINLLTNAIKFTKRFGTVKLITTFTKDREFIIEVTDTGIGIAEENMEKVLEPFGQVGETATKVEQGTGLGLPISISYAKTIGAKFEIQSVLNKGTTCKLTFPAIYIINNNDLDEENARSAL